MQKLVTALAATSALALFASSALACDFHKTHVTASAAPVDQNVAMSTYDGPAPLPIVAEQPAQPVAAQECPPDAKDCVPTIE